MATIHTSVEAIRGCGWRKAGGKYLVGGALSEPCPKLPIEVHVCPTCGGGIKQARGWTWIQPHPLLDPGAHADRDHDDVCPLGQRMLDNFWSKGERAGLIWIGARHYPTPGAFMEEAATMGVSRRVHNVPREFQVGRTWIALAHPQAIPGECEHGAPAGQPCSNCPKGASEGGWRPAVITFFRPTAIEYIVTGDEDEETLDRLERRGFKLVKVVRAEQQTTEGEA